MKNKKIKKTNIVVIAVLTFSVIFMTYLGVNTEDIKQIILGEDVLGNLTQNTVDTKNSDEIEEKSDNLKVYFIDVGQGDSILIEKSGKYALVDAGPNSSEDKLVSYIKSLGIEKFTYIFGTHAHEDHIGGMDKIIKNFNFDNIIFPNTSANTITFEKFIDSIISKGKKIEEAKSGVVYNLDDVKIEVLSPEPLAKYDNQNNYSIVLKVTYGKVSYLLMGDAEKLIETSLINNNKNLSADVLKVGHHGSTTSTSAKFLDAVSPKYAVICVGENNDYGHPKEAILKRLSIRNIQVFRTDINGTIISESDGNNIKFTVEKGESK